MRLTLPLAAATAFVLSACGPSPESTDLLDAKGALVEASAAGLEREALLARVSQGLRINDVLLRGFPAGPPGLLRFALDIPKDARLQAAVAIDPRFHDRPGVEFVVKVRRGKREDVAFSLVVDPIAHAEHRFWVPVDVDLARFAGSGRELVLETRGYEKAGDAGHAFWGIPAITVSRKAPLAIVYLVDTLRADHTGVYGYERKTTPELDAFAKDAVVFETAVAHASWTKPSVASILTSHLPGQHRAVQLRDPLDPAQVTLAQRLDARGFATGAAIANSVIYGAESAFDRGFDLFAGLHGDDDTRSKLVGADVVVDQALAFLRSRRGLPTFLYVHTMDPHVPYAPPAPFDRMFEPHASAAHPARDPRTDYKEPLDRERMIAQYDGDVAFGDQEFGRFVRELKAMGLYDDALVVFLADHGEEFQDHGLWLHGRSLFDELIHIPLVVKFPGNRNAGHARRAPGAGSGRGAHACSRRCRWRSRPISPADRCSARSSATRRRVRRSPRSATAASWPTACAPRTRSTSAASAPTTTSCCSTCGATRARRRASPRRAPSGCACARPRSRRAWRRTRSATCCRSAAPAGFRCGSRRTAGSRRSSSPGSGRRSARSWAATGERWTCVLQPHEGAPREIAFTVRPIGAPVQLSGTRDGRPLRPLDVGGRRRRPAPGGAALPAAGHRVRDRAGPRAAPLRGTRVGQLARAPVADAPAGPVARRARRGDARAAAGARLRGPGLAWRASSSSTSTARSSTPRATSRPPSTRRCNGFAPAPRRSRSRASSASSARARVC